MSETTCERTWVWGVPFSRVDFAQALQRIERLVRAGRPSHVVTANLHFAMLSERDDRLRRHCDRAALVVADGMPIVWASRWRPGPLPERVAGADLVPAICGRAAAHGFGVYLLGAKPGVADAAARKLCERYPGLRIVGVHAPPVGVLSPRDNDELVATIRAANPDLLFVAFGQPKGEHWVAENVMRLGVPVCMQVGATFDFLAGRVRRAPRWIQRLGLEWFFRFLTDPWRLGRRYASNAAFALRMLLRDATTSKGERH